MIAGYKKYRYALSITSQFYFCGIPFRLDITPKCDLNCLYCFAMSRGGRRTSNKLLIDFISFEKKYKSILYENRITDTVSEMISKRVPVHFGGISDPFSNENTTRISKRILLLLNKYNYPVVLSTKNTNELLKEDLIQIIKENKNIIIQVSITTPDNVLSSKIEPNVPSTFERIKCMEILANEGIYCICRLQPLFITEIKKIINDLIPLLSKVKCKHVVIEYLKLPVERKSSLFDDMLKVIKWDAYEYYKKNNAHLIGREWILPNEMKWQNLQPLIDSIHKWGMTYGAGDYGLNHLSDTACCCGIDKKKGFSNWFQGNLGNVIRNSKSEYIRFSELDTYWYPEHSIKMVMNSNCRITGNSQGIFDYLKTKWNRPGTINAPDSFLGIEYKGDLDENGNCMYFRKNR